MGPGRGGKTQRRAAGRWRTQRRRQSHMTSDCSGCSWCLKACSNNQIGHISDSFNSMSRWDPRRGVSYTTTANRRPRKGSLLSRARLLTLLWRNDRTPVIKTWKNETNKSNHPLRMCAARALAIGEQTLKISAQIVDFDIWNRRTEPLTAGMRERCRKSSMETPFQQS